MQRIWPRLSGQELLHDLLGAPRAAARRGQGHAPERRRSRCCYRPRFASLDEIAWTKADAALIDEARVLVGPRRRPVHCPSPTRRACSTGIDLDAYSGDHRAAALREAHASRPSPDAQELDEAEFVTYGHIVVDEAQDLSPMELRVLKRRDLTGSMTIVGDMGQATTASSPASWEAVLEVLAPRRAPTRVDLTVSYRTPEEVLDFAAPTLPRPHPTSTPPRPVRRAGVEPTRAIVDRGRVRRDAGRGDAARDRRGRARSRRGHRRRRSSGGDRRDVARRWASTPLIRRDHESRGLSADLVVLPAEGANGLEFDAVVVVEPGQIAKSRRRGRRWVTTARGLRTLYVAMTRPTRRLAVIAAEELPATLR